MNRLTRYFTTAEQVLDSVGDKAAGERLRLNECPVTPDAPINIFLDAEFLATVVEESARRLGHAESLVTVEVLDELQWEVARRHAFARWLRQQQAHQYVQLHPAPTYDPDVPQVVQE